jgi:predicted nucleotidyltransferase
MEDQLKETLSTVCKLLEQHKVKYMFIGGTAVALNGYYRHSIGISGELTDKPDIDVWYNPTYENYYAILHVMEALGHDITEFKREQSPNPRKSFFKLEFENFTLDLLPEIKANIRFLEAYKRKETTMLDGVPVYFIGYFDLIEDKAVSARKKDIEDVEQLKRIKGEQ